MTFAFNPLDWLDGVPANVIANVIALLVGVLATRLVAKLSNRRIWSLRDPGTLAIFVAEDSREFADKNGSSYVRPATGVGQARALATIAPSLRTAYRNVDLGKVAMAGEGIERDRRSDLISLGGAKNNFTTREIMNALSQRYDLPVPSPREGLLWVAEEHRRPLLYEAEGGPATEQAGPLRDDTIRRDYGVIVKAPNPWNPKATVVVIYGASTHRTAAAADFFVSRRRWRRPQHFTALVVVEVTGGYGGEPRLHTMRPLSTAAGAARALQGPVVGTSS
jgi:hypothetical protein